MTYETTTQHPKKALMGIQYKCAEYSPPQGVGGALIFTAYVGSDQASTVHPKKYQEFQAPQKKYLNF